MTLQYDLSIASISDHLVRVVLNVPQHDLPRLKLTLPAWIPGSYMIRDFAKSVVTFAARDETGHYIPWSKTDKHTWTVESKGQNVSVEYLVHANDLSVRSAFINDDYAFLNGTSVFLCDEALSHLPSRVSINTDTCPDDWQIHTSLDAKDNHFIAEHYEELIDHPIFIGRCQTREFDTYGVNFTLLFSGNDPIDIDRITRDLIPICEHHLTLFSDKPPVTDYLFMTLISDKGYGGLEHRNSTALLFPRFDLPMPNEGEHKTDTYIDFLSLCSHELFHTWHVKRIKPDVMVKPNLGVETYTDQLWIYEGFTSYYDEVTLARVGLISHEQYCHLLSKTFTRVQQNSGRTRQSISESSFDAWTRFYKQDASATNVIVSYYAKGGIVALGLDLLLRQQSQGRYSLDDVMRILWSEYGQEESGTPWDVIQTVCKQHFAIDVGDYLAKVVYGTQDVPLATLLPVAGLEMTLRQQVGLSDKGGRISDTSPKNGFGATVGNHAKGLIINVVRENTPASNAGLMIRDIIIAVNGYEVTEAILQRFLNSQTETLSLLILREGRVLTLNLTIQNAVNDVCDVGVSDADTCQQWLSSWHQERRIQTH